VIEIGIVGGNNSGKTTLIEALIGAFDRQGIRTATIKHTSHSHQFDTPGKDSWRHRQAGAALTIAQSSSDTALYFEPSNEMINQVRAALDSTCQVWLIEGDRTANRPKVLVTRHLDSTSAIAIETVIASYGPTNEAQAEQHFQLDDISGLAAFLTNKFQIAHKGIA